MGERRPRIVLPARFSASASALRYGAEVMPRRLVEAVFVAGGEPLVVHPHAPGGDIDDDEVAERLTVADGVLLPGGGDLAAHRTGQAAHPSLYDVDDEQDGFDLAVARVCLERGIPLLAICRGLQVVNAVRGGTVVQDMAADHRHRRHPLWPQAGSQLARLVGAGELAVSCYHHQCIADPGKGLTVVAHSAEGVIEAVEMPEAPGWFLGVQWHPEDTWDCDSHQLTLFSALVAAARSYR